MPQKDKQFWCKCGYGPDDKKGINSHVYTLCATEKGQHGRVNRSPDNTPTPAPMQSTTPSPIQEGAPAPAAVNVMETIERESQEKSYPKELRRAFTMAKKKNDFAFFDKSVLRFNAKRGKQYTTVALPVPASERTRALRVWNISWWKIILGLACCAVGVFGIAMYAGSMNMFMGMVAIIGLVPGAFLLYSGTRNKKEGGYIYVKGQMPKATGRENTILITARWNDTEKRAVPESIEFKEVDEATLPTGTHMHLLRNNGKHYFELYNIINDKGELVDEKGKRIYAPVTMPDKKLITPEAFVIPSNMQPYKDYMEYNPPSAFQKIASGVLIIAMIVIGILMTMTTSKPPGQQGQVVKASAYQLPQELNYDIVWQ